VREAEPPGTAAAVLVRRSTHGRPAERTRDWTLSGGQRAHAHTHAHAHMRARPCTCMRRSAGASDLERRQAADGEVRAQAAAAPHTRAHTRPNVSACRHPNPDTLIHANCNKPCTRPRGSMHASCVLRYKARAVRAECTGFPAQVPEKRLPQASVVHRLCRTQTNKPSIASRRP
jgi:hypothetical protein